MTHEEAKKMGATHYLHSEYTNVYFYYKHDPNNGVHGFYKYGNHTKEWSKLKRIPKDWNVRYKPL